MLDFGLAKAMASDIGARGRILQPPSRCGRLRLGSSWAPPAYMSPEQAKGKPVDRRADIWAFGVVLVEMLTGRRVFTGETVSETLAAVLMKQPDFSGLPPQVPFAVRGLIDAVWTGTKDPPAGHRRGARGAGRPCCGAGCAASPGPGGTRGVGCPRESCPPRSPPSRRFTTVKNRRIRQSLGSRFPHQKRGCSPASEVCCRRLRFLRMAGGLSSLRILRASRTFGFARWMLWYRRTLRLSGTVTMRSGHPITGGSAFFLTGN